MSDRAPQARHQAQARVAVVHVKEGTVRSEDAQNSPYPDDQDEKACLSDICWGSSAIGHPPAWGVQALQFLDATRPPLDSFPG